VLAGLLVVLVASPPGTAAVPGPIHAGNTYGWYYKNNVERHEFHGRLPAYWHRHGAGDVRDQHGMITLETHKGSLQATLTGHSHTTGRWEVRLRSRAYQRQYADYSVVTELVPAKGPQHCGAQDVGLESYRTGHKLARMYDHTLTSNNFHASKGMRLHNDQWHTFAVEVTHTHISWFVDAHVVRTERRPAALAGVPMKFRFALEGTPGKRMNQTRLQADWMRYWTYNRPSTKSIKAPEMHKGTYRKAC